MVQVDISTHPRVVASTCSDAATLLSHQALGDCMIVDGSSPCVVVHGGKPGLCGTVTTSVAPRHLEVWTKSNVPLWQSSLSRKKPCARTRLELKLNIAGSSQSRKLQILMQYLNYMPGSIRIGQFRPPNRGRTAFQDSQSNFSDDYENRSGIGPYSR